MYLNVKIIKLIFSYQCIYINLLNINVLIYTVAIIVMVDTMSSCMYAQYFSPYLSSDMHKMAAAFNTTVAGLEDEVMQLILEGRINARIDSHKKVDL